MAEVALTAVTATANPTSIGLQGLSNGNVLLRYSSTDVLAGAEVRNRVINFNDNEFNFVSATYAANSVTAGDQTGVRSSRFSNGVVLEVWQSNDAGDGSGTSIQGRLVNGTGLSMIGTADFIINTTTAGDQRGPAILSFDDGRRLVYWTSVESGNAVIRGRWVAADDDNSVYGADTASSPVDGSTSIDWVDSDFIITQFTGVTSANYSLSLTPDMRVVVIHQGTGTTDASGQGVQAVILDTIGAFTQFPAPGDVGTWSGAETSPFDLAKPAKNWTEAGEQISRSITSTVNFNDVMGSPHQLTYAYRDSLAAAEEALYYGNNGASGFSQFNADQIAQAEVAIQLLEDVANIDFVRVQTNGAYSDDANLLLWNYANAASNSQAASASGFGFRSSNGAHASNVSANGYTWRHFSYLNDDRTIVTDPTVDNGGASLLIHEIGHTIGLSHPGSYNISAGGFTSYASDAIYREDSRQYTVMSYFEESVTHAVFGSTNASTPLLHDIAALQRLYGANTTTRTGNTIYGFNSNTGQTAYTLTSATDQRVFSVWDAGGTDTFDFSGYAMDQIIDLYPEHFSSVGGLKYNISIARDAIIENAIGGSGMTTSTGTTQQIA